MKFKVLILVIILSGVAMAASEDLQATLKGYLWKNRVLIFLTDSPSNPTLEREKIAIGKNRERIEERNIVALFESEAGGELHKKFKAKGPFTAVLIGKDGGEKWRKTTEFALDEVFKEIDAMPMRKIEKSASNVR